MKKIYLLSIILALFLFLLSFRIIVYNAELYNDQFLKDDTYSRYNQTFVNNFSLNLINYLQAKEELEDYYNEREIIHLKDVKELIDNTIRLLYLVSFILILIFSYLIYKEKYKEIGKLFYYSGLINLIIILVLTVFFLTNFQNGFIIFHKIFFTNDYWILSNDSLLVNIFTEYFFMQMLKLILLIVLSLSILFILFGKIFVKHMMSAENSKKDL